MSEKAFSNVRACVFDAYGTLFDVHSAVARHRPRIGELADQLSAPWRERLPFQAAELGSLAGLSVLIGSR